MPDRSSAPGDAAASRTCHHVEIDERRFLDPSDPSALERLTELQREREATRAEKAPGAPRRPTPASARRGRLELERAMRRLLDEADPPKGH